VADNEAPRTSRSSSLVWVVILILALAVGLGLFWYIRSSTPVSEEQVAQTRKIEPVPTTVPTTVPSTTSTQTQPRVIDLDKAKKETELAKAKDKEAKPAKVEKKIEPAKIKEEDLKPAQGQAVTEPTQGQEVKEEAQGQEIKKETQVGEVQEQAQVKEDQPQLSEMEKRKKEVGVEASLDAVVEEGETVKLGQVVVPMDKILAQIRAKKAETEGSDQTKSAPAEVGEQQGQVQAPSQTQTQTEAASQARTQAKPQAQTEAASQAQTQAKPQAQTEAASQAQTQAKPQEKTAPKKSPARYGIYVVRPGDNLWNVHFNVLREYFASRGVKLAPFADEPEAEGRSSGVARILKYAEKMVHIYNLKTGQLSNNLDLIHPDEKIIIFNLTVLDSVLGKIDPNNIKNIRFDGTNLYTET